MVLYYLLEATTTDLRMIREIEEGQTAEVIVDTNGTLKEVLRVSGLNGVAIYPSFICDNCGYMIVDVINLAELFWWYIQTKTLTNYTRAFTSGFRVKPDKLDAYIDMFKKLNSLVLDEIHIVGDKKCALHTSTKGKHECCSCGEPQKAMNEGNSQLADNFVMKTKGGDTLRTTEVLIICDRCKELGVELVT